MSLGISRVGPAGKSSLFGQSYNISFIGQACSVKIAGIGLVRFCFIIDLGPRKRKKELGQFPGILTNAYIYIDFDELVPHNSYPAGMIIKEGEVELWRTKTRQVDRALKRMIKKRPGGRALSPRSRATYFRLERVLYSG